MEDKDKWLWFSRLAAVGGTVVFIVLSMVLAGIPVRFWPALTLFLVITFVGVWLLGSHLIRKLVRA